MANKLIRIVIIIILIFPNKIFSQNLDTITKKDISSLKKIIKLKNKEIKKLREKYVTYTKYYDLIQKYKMKYDTFNLYKKNIDSLNKDITKLSDSISKYEQLNNQMLDSINKKISQISNLQKEITNLKEKIQKNEDTLKLLDTEIYKLNKNVLVFVDTVMYDSLLNNNLPINMYDTFISSISELQKWFNLDTLNNIKNRINNKKLYIQFIYEVDNILTKPFSQRIVDETLEKTNNIDTFYLNVKDKDDLSKKIQCLDEYKKWQNYVNYQISLANQEANISGAVESNRIIRSAMQKVPLCYKYLIRKLKSYIIY